MSGLKEGRGDEKKKWLIPNQVRHEVFKRHVYTYTIGYIPFVTRIRIRMCIVIRVRVSGLWIYIIYMYTYICAYQYKTVFYVDRYTWTLVHFNYIYAFLQVSRLHHWSQILKLQTQQKQRRKLLSYFDANVKYKIRKKWIMPYKIQREKPKIISKIKSWSVAR